MSSNDTCIAAIPANPDIAGIGIRTSVYVTTVLLSLVTGFASTENGRSTRAPLLVATAGLQGLTLLITAIVQTSQRQLSLYHGFIIFHLLAFLGFQLVPTYLRSPDVDMMIRLVIGTFTQLLATAAYLSWMIYLMVTAPTFGPAELQPCNDRVLYVFFFKSVPATKKWIRIVAGIFGAIPLQITIPVVGPLLTAVYGIVTLELVVSRNALVVDEGEDKWGFGQLLAMVLLLQPLKEITDFLLSCFDGGAQIESPGFVRAVFRLVPLWKQVRSSSQTTSTSTGTSDDDNKIPLSSIGPTMPTI